VKTTLAATASWPSRKTVAVIGRCSPTTARVENDPQETTGGRVDQHRSASITNPPHDGLVPQSNKTSAHRHRFPIPTCMLTTMTHTASPLRAWVNWFLGPRMHGRYIKVASEGHGDEAGLPSPFLNTRQPHTWSRCWLAIKTECIICFKIDTK
jgi:hypothetical protein